MFANIGDLTSKVISSEKNLTFTMVLNPDRMYLIKY
jgi:hypothetical protein